MMKSVQAVLLFLMMMMMMMVSVSAGPLPPLLNTSRHDDRIPASPPLLKDTQENSTRFESPQNVNNSLGDFTRHVSSNMSLNGTSFGPFMDTSQNFPVTRTTIQCVLSTCLTANLGAALQGGDEVAGKATTDPHGIGKK